VEKIEGDVKATLRKMETIIGAATGSDNPSPHDRSVASEARALAQEARAELSAQAVGRGDAPADEASATSRSPPVEESEEYGAATRPVRPPLKSPTDSLRAYQES
jgi:riboflavin biosynthesis pyrimidine reductase